MQLLKRASDEQDCCSTILYAYCKWKSRGAREAGPEFRRDRCFLENIVITHSFALYRFCAFLICDVRVANLVEVLVPNLNCGCILKALEF